MNRTNASSTRKEIFIQVQRRQNKAYTMVKDWAFVDRLELLENLAVKYWKQDKGEISPWDHEVNINSSHQKRRLGNRRMPSKLQLSSIRSGWMEGESW